MTVYPSPEEASIYTAADGLFGDLYIFTEKGEEDPEGFLFMGSIDGGITDEEELFRTIVAAFEGQEINRGRFAKLTITNSDDREVGRRLAEELGLA